MRVWHSHFCTMCVSLGWVWMWCAQRRLVFVTTWLLKASQQLLHLVPHCINSNPFQHWGELGRVGPSETRGVACQAAVLCLPLVCRMSCWLYINIRLCYENSCEGDFIMFYSGNRAYCGLQKFLGPGSQSQKASVWILSSPCFHLRASSLLKLEMTIHSYMGWFHKDSVS